VRKYIAATVGALALTIGLVSPASATTADTAGGIEELTTGVHEKLDIDKDVACGLVTLTYKNPTDWLFVGDYKVDDEAPSNTDDWGDVWNLVTVDGREDIHEATVEIPVSEDSGEHTISYRWARGAESDLYDPERWWTVTVSSDCHPSDPVITQPTCEDTTGSITIPESDKWSYTIKELGDVEGQPIEAGDHDIEAGAYVVEAGRGEYTKGTWPITVDPSPTEEDCAPPPTDPPTDPEPNDCDAYEGSDAWCNPDTDDYNCPDIDDADKPVDLVDPENDPFGLDADNDGVGCEVTTDPTTEPTSDPTDPAPDGDDDGSLPDTGDLPDTGVNWQAAAALAGLLLLVGAGLTVARQRRMNV